MMTIDLRTLYSLTIATGSLLLFALQPIMAKALLPRFGGSAGVWVACMLFFQVMLLAGYFYSWVIATFLGRQTQSTIHATLLIASLATAVLKPIEPPVASPTWSILLLLLTSIGLPYFLLAANSPIMQAWFARTTAGRLPWRFFALSNAASLIALLAYPVIIEPLLSTTAQLRIWWIAYAAFVLLALAAARRNATSPSETEPQRETTSTTKSHPVLWFALAACASALWMAVANHLSQEVAPVPFLWVLPLGIYLLTFILCFESERWYRPVAARWLLPIAWLIAAARISSQGPAGLVWEVTAFSIALFLWCMFCHGEIARTKPTSNAPFFYLIIAAGGAFGAFFVAVIAPNTLDTYLELPIGIAVSVVLALRVLYGLTSTARLLRLTAVALAAFIAATRFSAGFSGAIHIRNFYGALQISDDNGVRTLYNGKTLHGAEFLAPEKRRQPTAYYGPNSGAGLLLSHSGPSRHVALVGLGAGTLAAYARPNDTFHFYEINPAVIEVARHNFHFLDQSPATTNITEADGRLALEQEPPDSYDIIVLDAFSGDSIPVHLLTREAFALYFRLLHANGSLAVHITNRYLDLSKVVQAAAYSQHKRAIQIHSEADPQNQILAADWILVTDGAPSPRPTTHLWTDDYSNLFQVLK